MMHRPLPRAYHRRAYTLIELVMAASLTALAIVPALSLMRDSIEQGTSIDTQNMIATLCMSKLEEHLALAAATFTETNTTGDFSREGYGRLKYTVNSSTAAKAGGIPDQLMAISVTVWSDADNDTQQDIDESSLTLATKLAKMVRYEGVAEAEK